MPGSKKILGDHKKRGSILVTPFNHTLGPLGEVSWIKTMIPELLWIALIQRSHGHKRGVEIITHLARTVRAVAAPTTHNAFASMSSYEALSTNDAKSVKDQLSETSSLSLIQESLTPLLSWYPFAPLRCLFDEPAAQADAGSLSLLRDTVGHLYARDAFNPMMVQATAVWLAFDSGLLKVAKGLALASFPEIQNYPKTELSQKVGSGIRSGLNAFFGSSDTPGFSSGDWPTKFWDHGLSIDPCALDAEHEDE